MKKRTVGWLVRRGKVRGQGDYVCYAELLPNDHRVVAWDRGMAFRFSRKFDAEHACAKLDPKTWRLVRVVRRRRKQ